MGFLWQHDQEKEKSKNSLCRCPSSGLNRGKKSPVVSSILVYCKNSMQCRCVCVHVHMCVCVIACKVIISDVTIACPHTGIEKLIIPFYWFSIAPVPTTCNSCDNNSVCVSTSLLMSDIEWSKQTKDHCIKRIY